MSWYLVLVVLFFIIPLLIWHFLVFPNLDGVVQDLSWYKYDNNSQHFLYWFGFWFIVMGFGAGSKSIWGKKQ